jgi:uncharacterized protein YjbI with pentapeptide repeats
MSRQKDIQQLIKHHQRRLQKRKLQQAQYGLATEPHILTEIEDIETQLAELQAQLAALDTITHLNPYQGLAPFREEHADLFFGRETFADHLVTRLQTRPLVALLGPSGSGKSSLTFAGIIPRLRQPRRLWCLGSFRPGPDPFKGLAAGLLPLYEPDLDKTDLLVKVPKVAGHLQTGELPVGTIVATISKTHPKARHILLIADQFEELFTLTDDPTVQHHFLDRLLAALHTPTRSRLTLHLLLTLRADFLGQALLYTPLRDALQDNLELLGPLAPDQLRAAIEQPAALRGVTFEPGLIDLILSDIVNQPGSLPLLEFALTTLWEHQTHATLTHAAYNQLGRVAGALSHHAEDIFATLSQTEQTQAERLFLRLVQPGDTTEATRRLAYRHDLAAEDWPLVQKLADERLVVTNRDTEEQETVELAHEALIQGWPRLQTWLETDRAFLTWRKSLQFSLTQWQATHQDPAALLRGPLLQTAETWLTTRHSDLSPPEQAFIQASQALSQEEMAVEAETSRQLLVLGIRTGKKDLKDADLRGTDLWGADLSGADLSGADLSGTDLSRADLSRATLSEADLSEADLSGADLSQAHLSGADLSEADLSQANLHDTIIDDKTRLDDKWKRVWQIVNEEAAGLTKTSLSRGDLSRVNMSGTDLSQANLSQANLSEVDLSGTDLRGTNLSKANLSRADLSGANLSEVNLSRANLSGANLSGVDLRGVDLSEVDLSGIDLSGVDLSGIDLSGVSLSGANLSGADLSGIDLSGVNLSEVNLSGVNLSGVDLRGADLKGANLSGANLSGADLRWADLRGTIIDDETQLDDKWKQVWRIVHEGAAGLDLRGADLNGVNLNGASLTKADLTKANLREAIYDTGTQWPVDFDPKTAGAIFRNIDHKGEKPRPT